LRYVKLIKTAHTKGSKQGIDGTDSKIEVLLRNIKETLDKVKHSEDGFAEYFTATQENFLKNPDPYIFSSRKIK
jgi:hypothetical protein